jgi:hypothetical protein
MVTGQKRVLLINTTPRSACLTVLVWGLLLFLRGGDRSIIQRALLRLDLYNHTKSSQSGGAMIYVPTDLKDSGCVSYLNVAGELAHMRHISRQHALVRRRSAQ